MSNKLVKPKPRVVEQLDWSDCIEYLEKKYDFNNEDYAGMFTKDKVDEEVPYLNFWHWLIDVMGISNGTTFELDKWYLDNIHTFDGRGDTPKDKDIPAQYRGWKKKIIGYVLDEFGNGKDKKCEFVVSW